MYAGEYKHICATPDLQGTSTACTSLCTVSCHLTCQEGEQPVLQLCSSRCPSSSKCSDASPFMLCSLGLRHDVVYSPKTCAGILAKGWQLLQHLQTCAPLKAQSWPCPRTQHNSTDSSCLALLTQHDNHQMQHESRPAVILLMGLTQTQPLKVVCCCWDVIQLQHHPLVWPKHLPAGDGRSKGIANLT